MNIIDSYLDNDDLVIETIGIIWIFTNISFINEYDPMLLTGKNIVDIMIDYGSEATVYLSYGKSLSFLFDTMQVEFNDNMYPMPNAAAQNLVA